MWCRVLKTQGMCGSSSSQELSANSGGEEDGVFGMDVDAEDSSQR